VQDRVRVGIDAQDRRMDGINATRAHNRALVRTPIRLEPNIRGVPKILCATAKSGVWRSYRERITRSDLIEALRREGTDGSITVGLRCENAAALRSPVLGAHHEVRTRSFSTVVAIAACAVATSVGPAAGNSGARQISTKRRRPTRNCRRWRCAKASIAERQADAGVRSRRFRAA
jgi:hypothetical protein